MHKYLVIAWIGKQYWDAPYYKICNTLEEKTKLKEELKSLNKVDFNLREFEISYEQESSECLMMVYEALKNKNIPGIDMDKVQPMMYDTIIRDRLQVKGD